MNAWANFNDAEEQSSGDVIPKNTLAKVYMSIKPGGYNDPDSGWTEGMATRSESTGSVYLSAEFTIVGGKYNKRKVWSLIGLYSPKGPKWGQMGRTFIRAALESARGIRADDASEKAIKARQIASLADLDGLEFVAKIDVQAGEDGYDDKNVIQTVIPVTHREYASLMSGEASPEAGAGQAAAPKAPAGSSAPAWAN